MWLQNISCLLLLLFQIFTISGNILPRDYIGHPTFQRSSVEFVPEHNKFKADLISEPEVSFSRSAVEAIPTTRVSEFLPLRSAVEFVPFEDDHLETTTLPFSFKKKFMAIVTNKRSNNLRTKPSQNNVRIGAFTYPLKYQTRNPGQYRADSPYQELLAKTQVEESKIGQLREVIRRPVAGQKIANRRPGTSEKYVKGNKKSSAGPKVICFVTNWSFYRKDDGKFVPENIVTDLCSHIIYSYASLDPETLKMIEFDPWGDIDNMLYKRTTLKNGDVPVLLGLGGWTDSTGDKYTKLVSDPKNRFKFITDAISFLNIHGFSGLHVDWNYPVCWQSDCRQGPASDKQDFTKFIQELSAAFSKRGLLLSASISGYKEIINKAYDMKALSNAVDFLTVMTYDYHGSWESKTGHVSPLYGDSNDEFPQYNSDHAMQLLVALGADKEKLVMGVPFYGQSFELSTAGDVIQGFESPADGPGRAGEFTNQPGMLAYHEICYKVKKQKWKIGKDTSGKSGPFATSKSQWVGYDDVPSMIRKADYVKQMGFGGIAAWTIDLDDFQNRCCKESFPLLKAINRAFGRIKSSPPKGQDCTRPPAPVTPTPPLMTTTPDSGAAGIPGSTKPTTTTAGYDENEDEQTTKSTSMTWWSQPTTTPVRTTRQTTTKVVTAPSTTTRRTTRRTTTTRPPQAPTQGTTLPVPGVIMPVVIEGEYCDTNGYRAHPENCNAYFRCVNNALVQQFCAGGLHWNPEANLCDWPDSANCNAGESPAEDEPVESPPTKPSTTTTKRTTRSKTTRKPSTTSTTTTTTTTLPPPTTRRTTRRTRSTTRRTSSTTTTTEATTTRRITTTTKKYTSKKPTKKPNKKPSSGCQQGQFYPHKNCDSFYICINNRKVEQQCPDGLQWNNDQSICDWPDNVRCVSARKYLRLINAQERDIDDPCDGEDYVPYPGRCNEYLICLFNRMEAMSCPDGLFWNDQHKACDWPENVDCDGNDSGDDNELEGGSSIEEVEENNNEIPDHEIDEIPDIPSSTKKPPQRTTKKPQFTTVKPVAPANPSNNNSPGMPVPDEVQPLSGHYKLVCYYTNWSWYRRGTGKYVPENIDTNLCTHVVYGFAVLDYTDLTIKTHDPWADIDNKFYERVVAMKEKGIKVTLAIGGWNDSEGDKYSRLVRNPQARAKFIRHVIEFIERFGFEGLDLDWEYPKCWQVDCTKGFPDEKEGFAAFVRELSAAFQPRGLLLSAAVSPSKKVIDEGYDVKTLARYFDWIAVMTYDFHGQWDKKTGHVAPLYYHPEDDIDYFNGNYSINYWIQKGAPKNKLVMGMPMYGQSFTLADAKNNGLNARAPGPGQAGEFTRAAGFLAYYEICDRVLNKGWKVVKDPQGRMGPYAYSGTQWVSYDDQETLKRKAQYIRAMGLAGGMIWALDLDDFNNRCGQGKHPLLKVIQAELRDPPTGNENVPGVIHPEDTDGTDAEYPDNEENPDTPEENPDEGHGDSGNEPEEHEPENPEESETPEHPDVPEQPETPEESKGDEDTDYSDENEVDENEDFKVVCYFTNWAWYRPGIGKYVPEDINADLCTHIVYGFAVLNRDTLTIKPHDSWADLDNKFYERAVEFKNKGIKVTVAIGGWNDSAGDKYSKLVRDAAARARFIKHVIEFIEKYGFEGLDLDWEYPVCWQVDCDKGYPDEKESFARLVEELSAEFRPRGWLLSAAVSPSKKVIDAGYEVATLSDHFDWIAVMAYDYHGQWDKKTGHVAPMYEHPDDFDKTFNSNFSINYWISEGADPKKIVMGMPMYGQSFSLAERSNNGLNAQTYGGGEAGEFTRARGFLSYYEICTRIRKNGWEVVRDRRGRMGPYAFKGDQWVSFDDIGMIKHKSEFVKAMGLGGAMIWALDLDDFRNVCECEEYPLLKTINRVLRNYPASDVKCKLESGSQVPTTTYNVNEPAPKPPAKNTPRPATSTEVETDDDSESDTCNSNNMFVAHESDCNKYYICEHGNKIPQACPAGLHWNKDHCDWPQQSSCGYPDQGEEEEEGEQEQEEAEPKPEDYEDNEVDEPPIYVESTTKSTQKPTTTQRTTTQRTTTQKSTTVRKTTRPASKKTTKPQRTTQKPEITTVAVPTTTARTKPTTINWNTPWAPPASKKPLYDDTDKEPTVATGNNEYMMVCYFTNWAWYRPGDGKFLPEHTDENLCTHIVYGFAVLNRETLTIRTHDSWADIDNRFYTRVSDYKKKGVKVSLGLGGWNDSLGDKYSRLVRDPAARARFVTQAIEFIEKFGFEGLDLDWEYPVCWQVDCAKGKKDEKEHFASLVKELAVAFRPRGWLLSSAVSPSKTVIDLAYDIPTLSEYFDWIAVMTYDFHGQWDKKTGHLAPLYYHPDDDIDFFNANFSINYWIQNGAPAKKIVMGMPMYGQAFTLADAKNNGLNAKAPGPGQAGKYTRAAGFLAYYEICDKVNSGGWTVVRDPEGRMGPYAYSGNQWVSYDDVEDIRRKTEYVKRMGLAGAMIWALDLDDFRGRCGCGRSPLLRTINLELGRISTAKISNCT